MPAPLPESRSSAAAAAREQLELAWFGGVCTGDEAAFESLFRAYAGPLHAFAYSYVGSQTVAQEIVQDLFARMWERRETLEVPRSVYAYLFSATRNRAISHLRSQRAEQAFLARALQAEGTRRLPSSAPQEQDLEAQTLEEALDRAVLELPPRCREVFALIRGQQLSHAQVAEVLRISPKTVQIHMGRALALLRQKLRPWLQG